MFTVSIYLNFRSDPLRFNKYIVVVMLQLFDGLNVTIDDSAANLLEKSICEKYSYAGFLNHTFLTECIFPVEIYT